MTLFLPNSSPLAFPAGRAPGFDPAHPQGALTRLCAVALGTQYINLIDGKMSTQVGTVGTPVIKSGIGNAINVATTQQNVWSYSKSFASDQAFTMAAIVQVTTIASASFNVFIEASQTASNGWALLLNNGVLGLSRLAGTNFVSGITIPINTPFFVAATNNIGANIINYIAVNLLTGVTLTGASASTSAAGGSSGFGVNALGGPALGLQGSAAAYAYISTYLGPAGLAEWAADPWGFWYLDQPDAFDVDDFVKGTTAAFTWFGMDEESNYPKSWFMREMRAHD